MPAKFLHPFSGIGGAGGPPSPPIMPDFIHFRDRGSTRGNALSLLVSYPYSVSRTSSIHLLTGCQLGRSPSI
jgi:hypothetical protein